MPSGGTRPWARSSGPCGVLPEARGCGIGGALVSALARWSRDTAPRRDLIITAEQGGPADRLYAALGFSRVSTSHSWGMPAPLDAPTLARRWAALQAGRLPMAHWRHRGHLWGAVCALEEAEGDVVAATDRLRAVLHGHLAAHGVETTPTQGYHETLTRGWLHLVEAGRRAHPGDSRVQAVIRAQLALGDELMLLRHWQRDTLMGAASRAAWVPPDKAPLPRL